MGGIVLAGPDVGDVAAAAFALTLQSARRYTAVPALTDGPADTMLAEHASAAWLADLRAWAQVLVSYRRGPSTWVFDHERLRRVHDDGRVAVVGTDEPRVVAALPADWLRVLPRGPVLPRTWTGVAEAADLVIRTDQLPPTIAAVVVHTADMHRPDSRPSDPDSRA